MLRYWLTRAIVFAVFAAAVLALPYFLSDFRELQFGYVAIYFIAILGLNVLTGYTGQISLGHGAFMMVGAYTTAILVADHAWNVYATIPVAALVAGLAGLVFGFPALRFSPVHLALATFGLAIAVPALSRKFVDFTGGSSGKFLPISFPTGHYLYYLAWGIALGMFVVGFLFLRGRTGRALRAVRDGDIAAMSSGVDVTLYKTLAFGFSAAFAGVAGSLFGIANVVVSPELFPITLSILLLTGTVVAGLGSLTGIYVGALFAQFVPIYAGGWVGDLFEKIGLGGVVSGETLEQQAPAVVYGTVLILLMFLLPTGFAGLVRRITYPLTNRLGKRQINMPPRPTTPEGDVQ
jgi:branched-chain amino acid transport system permease protein